MDIRSSSPETVARPFTALILDFFFPQRCLHCRKTGRRICRGCADAIPWIGRRGCPLCGLPSEGGGSHRCVERGRLQFIRSAAEFSGAMRKALHALKYSSDRFLADELIRLAGPHWMLPNWEFDTLVPVPLGRERERTRGYNQSLLLAGALSRSMGIPVSADVLRRVRETQSQVGLSRVERKQNMEGAFRAAPMAGRRILLVDDVCTTGATLRSCAAALAEAGAAAVGALTLARAPEPGAGREEIIPSHGGIHDHPDSRQRIRNGDDPAP